jgi:hypothetical protein
VNESPFAPLSWDRTESSAGTVFYDVFVGTDSAAVATRRVSPVARVTQSYLIRSTERWGSDTTYYWAVTATNQTIGERVDGPVWCFRTASADAPIDSVNIRASKWGFYTRNTRQSTCFASTISSGSNSVCVVSWDPGQIQAHRSIVSARIVISSPSSQNPPGCAISSIRGPVVLQPCDFLAVGLPVVDEFLASSRIAAPFELRLASDALTAHLTAVQYGVPTYGYLIESNSNTTYSAPPSLIVTYYR